MQLVTAPRRAPDPSTNASAMPVPATRGRRPRQPSAADRCRRKPGVAGARMAGPSQPSAARLEQIEDALLGSLLDAHPNRARAMDRLLHDIDGAEGNGRPGDRLPPCVSAPENAPERVLRIEELLVAVVIDRHAKRPQSLDRLLRHLDERRPNEGHAAGAEKTGWDNDFDGLS